MLLQKTYRKEVELKQDEIVTKLSDSIDFKAVGSVSYGGQLYTSATMNKIYLRQIGDNLFQFSENAGLGGMFEIMGECQFDKLSGNKTLIKLEFTMGNYPVSLPFYLFIAFLLVSVIALVEQQGFGYLTLALSALSLLHLFVKRISIRFILKKFSQALSVENKWTE